MATAISPLLAAKAGNRAELTVGKGTDPVFMALTKWNSELVLSGVAPTGNEDPVTDGKAYVVQGQPKPFCRPFVKVAWRSGFQPGPEVRFEQRDDGMHLTVAFEEDAARRAAGAVPFQVKVNSVRLTYGPDPSDVVAFSEPLQEPLDPNAGPAFRIEVDAVVPPERKSRIVAALQAAGAAAWRVALEFQWIKIIPAQPQQQGGRPTGVVVSNVVRPGQLQMHMAVRDQEAPAPAVDDTALAQAAMLNAQIVTATRPQRLNQILVAQTVVKPVPQPTQKLITVNIDRALQAEYPNNTPENRAIFAAVDGDYVQVGWQSTANGWFQPTPIQDTVYTLPHAYRLQVDVQTGLPSIRALLLRKNAAGEISDTLDPTNYKVRLTLKARPDFDAERLNSLRALIRAQSSNTVKYADLVLGGYSAARFIPDSALAGLGELFAGLTAGGKESFDPAEGFTLTYEGNAEFIDLLFQRLKGEGIEGTVEFDLKQPGDKTQKQSVPVVLTLRNLASFPLPWTFVPPAPSADGTTPDPSALLPHAITIKNQATVPVALAGLHAHALQKSPVTGRVQDWFEAKPDGTWPRTLPAGQSAQVTFALSNNKELFNAWDIALVDSRTAASTELVLSEIFDAATSGVRGWKVQVDCPPLQFFDRLSAEDQARMSDLAAIEVEVRRLGSTAVDEVRLTKQTPTGVILLSRTVADFVSDRATGRSTFEYRQRALRLTRAEEWSNWRPETGSAVSVFLS